MEFACKTVQETPRPTLVQQIKDICQSVMLSGADTLLKPEHISLMLQFAVLADDTSIASLVIIPEKARAMLQSAFRWTSNHPGAIKDANFARWQPV